ncbi:hypothetical protein KW803_00625 [Candidatus Saccharibacteria bacterium]|nr:hypothetical protein [Candidatus Saccharibacteria bacterium]
MKRLSLITGILLLVTAITSGLASAQYNSSNYKANEVFFGTGGDNNQSSANYKASVSAGALGVGQVSSSNYQAYSGFLTPNEPFLEFSIDTSNVNLGALDPSSTGTGTANFHVRAYINTGYTVQTVSQPPSYTSGLSSHTLAPMTSLGTSTIGTEQFGMNLRQNNSPASFGNDPSPQPNGTYATGVAATGYDTPDQYKYNVGDIIAQTPPGSSGWGQTNFTISYIANMGSLTPAGDYMMIHDLVVVATY